ncbi:MAG: hypothetical protein ABIP53_06800, partial [Candidatus Limnocylindrales bacterium]
MVDKTDLVSVDPYADAMALGRRAADRSVIRGHVPSLLEEEIASASPVPGMTPFSVVAGHPAAVLELDDEEKVL